MSRTEWVETIAMILIIVLWWPVIFLGWGPPYYRGPLTVVSVVVVLAIFIVRLRRVNQGFSQSERLMQIRFEAEKKARGGDPSLDETRPPDVSSQLPFLSPKAPPSEDKKQ